MTEDGTIHIRGGGGRKALGFFALITTLSAAGAGYGAYTLWNQLGETRDEAKKLADERKKLADALDLHRATSVDLDGKLARCTDEHTTEKTSAVQIEQRRVDLETQLTACSSSVKNLEQTASEAKEMLAELKGLTSRFQKMIDAGKLDVTFRKGQMVVKLPAQVLFPSGSAELSSEGASALAEVAGILRQMRGRRFTIAGHTDNVAVGVAAFKDNWELSSARAVRVTRMLIEKGVPSANLVAAGYGEYDPIAANSSPAGRQRNRRIEIILEPNLKKVPVPDAIAAKEK